MTRWLAVLGLLISIPAFADELPESVAAEHNGIWLAGQPDMDQLQAWAEAGRTAVINIRPADELADLPFDASKATLNAGMTYAQFGVGGTESFDPSMTSALTRQLQMHSEENVVLHCVSGTRAAHIYTAHLIETGQIAAEDANTLTLSPRGDLNPAVMRQLSPRYAEAFPD